MQQFLQNLTHVLVAMAVIGAASALAAVGVISGAEALTVIGTAAGFSMGVGGASTSVSTAAAAMPAVSSSTGGSTTTITPNVKMVPAPTTDSAPVTS